MRPLPERQVFGRAVGDGPPGRCPADKLVANRGRGPFRDQNEYRPKRPLGAPIRFRS
jgi:hypothetical protein